MSRDQDAPSTPKVRRLSKPVDAWTLAERDKARRLLLEVSPFEVDGKELIGRDPREISVGEYEQAGINSAAVLAVIRAKCLDSCVQQPGEVRQCVTVVCPLWPYRLGTNPFHKREMSDAQRAVLAERMRGLKIDGRVSGAGCELGENLSDGREDAS